MDRVLWANLGIGASVGAILFATSTLNLPLSISAAFVVASAMNVLMMGRGR